MSRLDTVVRKKSYDSFHTTVPYPINQFNQKNAIAMQCNQTKKTEKEQTRGEKEKNPTALRKK
jgi:hypothetical protein